MTSPAEPDRVARRRVERERKAAVARRRRLALAVLAATAAAGGVVLGSRGGDDGEAGFPTTPAPPDCPPRIAADPARLVGQMLIVRMEGTAPKQLLRRVERGEIGGVVLFPPEGLDPVLLRGGLLDLKSAAAKAGAPAPLITIDQEGGEVKRLPSAPPRRSPAEIASAGAETARREGAATGRALARLGIDADLAPVLDAPGIPDAFIATRALGSDPASVAELGVEFGEGLQSEGVVATAKHFPGLGLATVNTDLAPSAIDARRRELSLGLEPFEAAIAAGFGLVMVSNATYPVYDEAHPASQSEGIITGLLRHQLGYDGVVITDDLGAGGLTAAGIDEGEAAIGAARAGADLLLFALSDGETARAALLRALRRGELDRERLVASCARTTALRERFATPRAGR